jgi:hypothetical protein
MSGQHRATPEQWDGHKRWAAIDPDSSCLLELRARIEALEATQRAAASAEAQPGGLVEGVVKAIHPNICADPNLYLHEARAAIRAVAAWLRTGRLLHAAELLEQEVGR